MDGDRMEVRLPLSLRTETLPGDETQQATMYGQLALAGRLGAEGLTKQVFYAENSTTATRDAIPAPAIATSRKDLVDWLKPVLTQALIFQTPGQERPIIVIPLYDSFGERYAVYWKTASTAV